jgi:hypothetical protein
MVRDQARSPDAVGGISLAEFQSQYDSYLLKRGLSRQTLKLHQQVLGSFFLWRFPSAGIQLRDLRFNDFARFLTREFERLGKVKARGYG